MSFIIYTKQIPKKKTVYDLRSSSDKKKRIAYKIYESIMRPRTIFF